MPRLCSALAVLMVALPGSGTTQTVDPVAGFSKALKVLPAPRNREAFSAHTKRLDALVRQIRSSADLLRMLTLPTWGSSPARQDDDELNRFKAQLRVRLGKTLLGALTRELPRGESNEHMLALLTLLRVSAIEEVANFEEQAWIFPSLAPPIVRLAAKTEQPAVRWAALRTLAHLHSPVRDMVELLKKSLEAKAVRERQTAAEVMVALLPAEATMRALSFEVMIERIVALLPLAAKGGRDENPLVRRRCLQTIAHAGKHLAQEVSLLRSSSNDDQKDDQQDSIKLLNPSLKAIAQALPAAVACLSDRDAQVSLAAHLAVENAASLRRALPRPQRLLAPQKNDKPANKDLGEEEQDLEDKEVVPGKRPRLEVEALAQTTLKAIPELEKSLLHKEIRVRLAALYVLETLAEDSASVAGSLAKLLKDDNRFVRWGAARALRNMAPAGAAKSVAALAEALADDSADVRRTAAVALTYFGRKAKDALKPLIKALEHKDDRLRLYAAGALASLETDAKPARAALVTRLKRDTQAVVRAAAATALGRTGPLDAPTREALVEALEDADATVQTAAASALLRKDL